MSVWVVIFEATTIRHHCIFDGYDVCIILSAALEGVFMGAQQYLTLKVTVVTYVVLKYYFM